MKELRLVFRVHAIQRMFQRNVSAEEVRQIVVTGETIETYPDDQPFPSRLMLGWNGPRPIHVVLAENTADKETIIITVYEPNGAEWEAGFRRRKRR